MAEVPARSSTEVQKRSYSEDEIAHIYELARFHLENGQLRKAETIFQGLTDVVPDFAPGWLGAAFIHIQSKNYDAAVSATRQALRLKPDSIEAMLLLVSCLLTIGDAHAAGTMLGEIGDVMESGEIDNPSLVRFYRAQLARYQNR